MMPQSSTIFRIPEHICVKIAAGEIIERPASVVKELLENSIDAGADSICVAIESGGKKLIKITDNGCGIKNEYAHLSLERFTTSKLNISSGLLENVDTMGFRGEALASIASISQLTLKTKTKDEETGTKIYCEKGGIIETEKVAALNGTEISVKNLFYNFPARKKFLKTDKTESGHIEDIFSKIALPYTDISFKLIVEGNETISLSKNENIPLRAKKIFPKTSVPDRKLSNSAGKYYIDGIITAPGIDFKTSSRILIYVNGRIVKDKIISHAALEALRTQIGTGRYPGGVIFLTMPPSEVDVNVHPAKAEVRFTDPGFIHNFVEKSIKRSFETEDKIELRNETSTQKQAENINFNFPGRTQIYGSNEIPYERIGEKNSHGYYSNLNVLGQLKNSYIICGDDKGVVIIDQHAAHERVNFEKLKEDYGKNKIAMQDLLFPLEFEMKGHKFSLLKENIRTFRNFGFLIEEFGDFNFILRSVPEILTGTDHVKTINDITDMISDVKSSSYKLKIIDEILETIACHSSIRFSKHLTAPEIQSLLNSLDNLKGETCPHGRPFTAALDEDFLKKMFKRI